MMKTKRTQQTRTPVQLIPTESEQPPVEPSPAAPVAKRTRRPRALPAKPTLSLTSPAKSPRKATTAKTPAKANGKAKANAKPKGKSPEGQLRAFKAHRTMLIRKLKGVRGKDRAQLQARIAHYDALLAA